MVTLGQRHRRVHFLAALAHERVILHVAHQVRSDLLRASFNGEGADLHPCGGQAFGHGVVEATRGDATATSSDGEHRRHDALQADAGSQVIVPCK